MVRIGNVEILDRVFGSNWRGLKSAHDAGKEGFHGSANNGETTTTDGFHRRFDVECLYAQVYNNDRKG